jgi:hypothetical protein
MGPTHHSQLSKEIEGVDWVLQAYNSLSLSLSLSVSDPKNAEVSGSHNKSCRHSENHSINLEAFGSFFGSEASSSSSSSAILHCGGIISSSSLFVLSLDKLVWCILVKINFTSVSFKLFLVPRSSS